MIKNKQITVKKTAGKINGQLVALQGLDTVNILLKNNLVNKTCEKMIIANDLKCETEIKNIKNEKKKIEIEYANLNSKLINNMQMQEKLDDYRRQILQMKDEEDEIQLKLFKTILDKSLNDQIFQECLDLLN